MDICQYSRLMFTLYPLHTHTYPIAYDCRVFTTMVNCVAHSCLHNLPLNIYANIAHISLKIAAKAVSIDLAD